MIGPQKAAIFMLALDAEHSQVLFEMMDDEKIWKTKPAFLRITRKAHYLAPSD
jgi:flagellar motor switch protein FliG